MYPHQGVDALPLLPTSKKACLEIWVGMKVSHTCIAYIAKPNNGSMKKYVILLDQDVHVCGYMMDKQILLCSLKHISLLLERGRIL